MADHNEQNETDGSKLMTTRWLGLAFATMLGLVLIFAVLIDRQSKPEEPRPAPMIEKTAPPNVPEIRPER